MKRVVAMIKKLIGIIILIIILWGVYVAYSVTTSPPVFKARWGQVTEEKTEIVITGKFQRPLLVPAKLDNLTMYFTGVKVAELEKFDYNPTKTNVTLVIALSNPNLIRAFANYLNGGQKGYFEIDIAGKALSVIPFNFKVKENFTMDILDKLNFTAESKPVLGGLAETPALLGTKVRWLGEEKNKGRLDVEMLLYNPNSFPIPVTNLTFNLYANGIKIGTGYLKEGKIIPANGYAKLDAIVVIDENQLPKVWAIHVRNGERSKVDVEIMLSANLAGRSIEIPLKTESVEVQTHIMEDINKALENITRR